MRSWVCIAVLLALATAGCGSETIVAVNNPPSIEFTFVPIGVPASFPVDLTVAVSDPDENDNLAVTWEITRGTLTPMNEAKTVMRWAVPVTLGVDTVIVTVSDGEAVRSVTEELKVGTLVRENALVDYVVAESPYILRPDNVPPRLLVNGSSSLEAGVEILVDVPETIVDVSGTLTLAGTSAEPVVFRANDRSLVCSGGRDWWNGILAGGAGGVINMDYAEIWYAKNGVHLRDSGSAAIHNSSIKCCGANGILLEGVGGLEVTETRITNVQSTGVSVSTLTLLPAFVSITDCNISINGNTGVSIDIPDQGAEVPITIEGNKFEFNFVHGITMRDWVWPTIHNNAFVSNGAGLSSIRLLSPFHNAMNPDSIDVSNNFWGAPVSSQSTIEDTIYDRLDSATLGTRLLVAPWLNTDPYTGPAGAH